MNKPIGAPKEVQSDPPGKGHLWDVQNIEINDIHTGTQILLSDDITIQL